MFNMLKSAIQFNHDSNKHLLYLKLEDIRFSRLSYHLLFRMHHKSTILTYTLKEILRNKLYNDLNPFDSYCVGIVHALNSNEIYNISNIAEKLCQFNHFDIKQQFDLVECNYLYGSIVVKSKNDNFYKKISIHDFIQNSYILYSFDCETAYKIGYFITDYLIDNQVTI